MASKTVRGFGDYKVEVDGFKAAAKDLRSAAPDLAKKLNAALKTAVAPVVSTAKSNASFSERIPGSISATATKTGVAIKAGGAKAPEAAAFENKGAAGTFRHPVFGNRRNWVSQKAHPFIKPALDAHVDADMLDAVVKAMDEVFAEAGFK